MSKRGEEGIPVLSIVSCNFRSPRCFQRFWEMRDKMVRLEDYPPLKQEKFREEFRRFLDENNKKHILV